MINLGRLSKHFRLLKHIGKFRFKYWLDKNASDFLAEIGIKEGQAILDFGCGSDTYTIPAAKLVGESGIVYALDVSRKALDRMEERAKSEELENIVRIDASSEREIPLENKKIDLALLIDVLQEIDDRAALFDEISRILKLGGAVCVYPMHIGEEEVEKLASDRDFNLDDKKFEGRILVFRKSKERPLGGSR